MLAALRVHVLEANYYKAGWIGGAVDERVGGT